MVPREMRGMELEDGAKLLEREMLARSMELVDGRMMAVWARARVRSRQVSRWNMDFYRNI